jgi:Concanavalin A-like lectin/glucanases superfamily
MKKSLLKFTKKVKLRTWVLLILIAVAIPFIVIKSVGQTEATNLPPIAYWAFNEATDNTCANGTDDACDQTSNVNGLTRTNATWRSSESCFTGNCGYYDGSGDYFSRADDSDFDYAAADSFSITGWFRSPVASATKYIVAKHNTTGSTGGYKIYMDSDGDIVCGIDDDDTFDPDASATSTNANYDDNQWHQFTCTKNGTSSLTLYIDGKQINQNTSISGLGTLANADTFYIGINGDGSTNGWSGFLDDIKVYNYVRSQAEINSDNTKQATTAGASATFGDSTSYLSNGLAGWWKMEESATPSVDNSGNSNSGTWTGSVAQTSGKYGAGAAFDAAGDVITTANSASISPTSNLTVAGWVKMDSAFSSTSNNGNVGIVDKGDYKFYLDKSDGKAKWVVNDSTAAAFSALSTGLGTTTVYALAVYNGNLYIGGTFTNIGDANGDGIVMWNGTSFSSLSTGLGASTYSLAVWNGSLYIGGTFSNIGDANGDAVVAWNGSAFSSLSTGLGASAVYSLTVWNGSLYIGGNFTNIGDANGDRVVAWNGSAFSSLSTGIGSGIVYTMAAWNGSLYIGGSFTDVGSASGDGVVAWNGSGFSALSTGLGTLGVYSLAVWNGSLYIGGGFTNIGDANGDGVVAWNGSAFSSLSTGLGTLGVYSLAVWNGNLYIGGTFNNIGDSNGDSIVMWNGSAFSSLSTGLGASGIYAFSIAEWNGNLYVGGTFTNIGDANGDGVVKWGTSSTKIVASTTTSYAASTWYHMAATYENGNLKLFVNGNLEGSATGAPSSIASQSLSLLFGRSYGSHTMHGSEEGLDGTLDDMRVYNRTLSPSEISSLYNAAPGPVGYWKLDENTGTTVYDSSSNGSTLTSTSSNWVQGKYGPALDLNGTSDVIGVDDPAALDIGLKSITITGWVYRESASTDDMIMGKKETGLGTSCTLSGDVGYQAIIYETDEVALAICDGTNGYEIYSAAGAASTNTWTHVAFVIDRQDTNNRRVYINGVNSTSGTGGTLPTGSISNAHPFYLGAMGNIGDPHTEWDGRLDDMKIYDYARSPKQVLEDYNANHPVVGTPISGPAGHWSLDEATGTTANDKSGNSNSLTLSTASWTLDGKYDRAWNGTGALWMSRADDADFDFAAAEDFTISGWFRSDSTTNPSSAAEYIVSKETSSAGYAIWATTTTAEIVCGIDDDGTSFPEDSAGDIAANNDYYDTNWHYVACVRNTAAGRLELYIDGKLVDADTSLSATGDLSNTDSLTFGDRNATNDTDDFNGDLDELKIYRAALSPSEILVDYNQGKQSTLGSISTASDGTTASNAGARAYCIPGDTTSCSAPIAEWRLEENTSTSVNDISGNGKTASFGAGSNSPTWTNGKVGAGVRFDESDDYIELPTTATVKNLSAYTMEAWIKVSSPSTNTAVIVEPTADDASAVRASINISDTFFGCSSSVASFHFRTGTSASTRRDVCGSTTLAANTWYHVAAVFDSTNDIHYLYLNGIVDGTLSVSETSVANTDPITNPRIGAWPDGSLYFGGTIDEVKVYNYARTPAQIQWSYNGGAPVGWWKMDDCTGTTVYDNSLTANGAAGGKNGAWTGASGGNTGAGTCSAVDSATAWYNGRNGKYGSSLDFDGADDLVTITNTSAIDFNEGLNNGYTWAAWINPQSDGESSIGRFFSKSSNATYCRTGSESGGFVSIYCEMDLSGPGPATVTASTQIPINTWSHVALTWTNDADDEITVWINGKNSGTSTDAGNTLMTDTGNTQIGGISLANFDGQIDDFRIYNYELTAAQMKTVFNEGATVRFGPVTGTP